MNKYTTILQQCYTLKEIVDDVETKRTSWKCSICDKEYKEFQFVSSYARSGRANPLIICEDCNKHVGTNEHNKDARIINNSGSIMRPICQDSIRMQELCREYIYCGDCIHHNINEFRRRIKVAKLS